MKKILSLLAFLSLSGVLFAQTSGLNFGVSGGAMGFYHKGSNSMGSVSVQNLSFTTNTMLEATQLLMPSEGVSGFFGDLRYNFDPSLFSKTVLPANTFLLSAHAGPGFVTSSTTNTKFGAFAGAELDYAPASDGKFGFGPRVDAVYLGNTQVALAYSLNLRYLWGGTTPTAAAQARHSHSHK